jgi:transcriptional regulator with XRE-family HTH domain
MESTLARSQTWSWNDVPNLTFQPKPKHTPRHRRPGVTADSIRQTTRVQRDQDPLLTNIIALIGGNKLARLAADADVSESTIINWCNGKTRTPRCDTIRKVAEALHLEIRIERRERSLKAVNG